MMIMINQSSSIINHHQLSSIIIIIIIIIIAIATQLRSIVAYLSLTRPLRDSLRYYNVNRLPALPIILERFCVILARIC